MKKVKSRNVVGGSKQFKKVKQAVPAKQPNQSKKTGWIGQTIVAVIVVLVVAGLSIFAFTYFTKIWWFAPVQPVKEKLTAQLDNTPLFTLEGYPRVDGSTATVPLNVAFKSNFTGEKIDEAKFEFSKTDGAYTRLINGETDLILVTSPSEDEKNRATAAGVELEVTPVVNEGFVFFVNKNNPVDNLTSEQIKQIYEGKIINWNQVGGNNEPIAAYQRPANSGSQTGMEELVMAGRQLVPVPTTMIAGSMADIINVVANYSNNPGALGYSYYFYATTMYADENAAAANNIKLLKIDGVEPNIDSIRGSAYPFRTAYYIVINKASAADSPTRKLQEAMLSPRGQAVAEEAGYVPSR